jgi:Ca-activated chloride channel homolog
MKGAAGRRAMVPAHRFGFSDGAAIRRRAFLILALVFAAALAMGGPAEAAESTEKTLSPYFVLEGAGGESATEAFPLKSTEVKASVNGVIAEVTVTQVYANEGKEPIHARYVFPASTRASVHGMKITIGDQAVVAKIREKTEAKQEFEKAKSEGKSASLLEEHRPNVFQMSVANILPGDRVEVELHYTELLVPEEGTYQFVYPTVVGPRYSRPAREGAPVPDEAASSPDRNGAPGSASALARAVHAVWSGQGSSPKPDGHSPGAEGAAAESKAAAASMEGTAPQSDEAVQESGDAAPEKEDWVRSPYLHDSVESPSLFDIQVTLSTGLPLQEVASPSHAVNVAWEGQALARVSLADPSRSGGNRDFILSYRLAGREIESGLLLYKGETENFFLLMVQPPERVRAADVPPREYLFVLDVSGSMSGFPLDTAKAVIRDLIGHLRETDLFDVVLFSGDSRVMSPVSLPATQENVRRAISMIEREGGGGGTELEQALATATGIPRRGNFSRTVVVITDGFIMADKEVFRRIEGNLGRTNFFCFGIGSSVNRYLVEGIARAGMGEPFVVTDPSEAAPAARRFREYIESPVLTGLEVRYDGFQAYDVEPSALPDLFARRPIVLFGKWRGDLKGEVEISGRDARGRYARSFRVSDVKPLPENGALRYLWARTRIARLSDFSSREEGKDDAAQITSLGLTYSLLTRHTSFIAVLEKIRNPEGQGKDVDHPLPLPQGVSDLAVGGAMASGDEPELWLLLILAGGSLVSVALLRRRRTLSRM